jgi:hypothetical protein
MENVPTENNSNGNGEAHGTDFSWALYALKGGKKVARSGWNGSGMFLWLCKHTPDAIFQIDFNHSYPVGDYIVIKTAQGTVESGWRPTSADMLAEDWVVVE